MRWRDHLEDKVGRQRGTEKCRFLQVLMVFCSCISDLLYLNLFQ